MTPPPIPTFDQKFFDAAYGFTQAMYADVPELMGVAVVPIWHLPQEHLPTGLLSGRNGPLTTPDTVMHMATAMHAALRQVLDSAGQLIQHYDTTMAQLAKELGDVLGQIDAQRATLRAASDSTAASSPDAAAEAGAGDAESAPG
jgi:hypothetical protein